MPRRTAPTVVAPRPAPAAPLGPLALVLEAFAGMMGVSYSQALCGLLLNTHRIASTTQDAGLRRELFYDTLVFEGVDTAIVLAALVLASRPLPRPAGWHRLGTWLLSAPGFAAVLAVNFGYHALLVYLFAPEGGPPPDELTDGVTTREGWRTVLTVCVQPALVEELFFRFLLLGHLRHHLGPHAAVWLSSVLFGMAHLGNVPGWPVLIVIGACLGYARVLSGGLALPVLLHFCHNLVVCLADEFGR